LPAGALPDFVHVVAETVHAVSASAPLLVYDDLEAMAVCDLCGLVVREPAPPACPACGGGFG
jgi:rubrerythrin